MELQAGEDAMCLLWWEGLAKGASGLGVELVLHHADAFHVGIALLDEVAQHFGVVLLGAVFGNLYKAPAGERFDHDEEVGSAVSFVFVVSALHAPRSGWQARTYIGAQHDWLLVQADRGVACVVGQSIERQHVYHSRHELATYLGNTPLALPPRLQLVFFEKRADCFG